MTETAAEGNATWREIGALFLLPFGALALPVLGWFVGVFLLWYSELWTRGDKLIGTLVIPGGILAPVMLFAFAGGVSSGTHVWPVVLVLLLLVTPLAADGYLIWRLRRAVPAA